MIRHSSFVIRGDQVPSWIVSGLPSVRYLELDETKLSGTMPAVFHANLRSLEFDSTVISGTLPDHEELV